MKKRVCLILLSALLLITFWTFYPALNSDFTNWDDPAYVVENFTVQGIYFDNLKRAFTSSFLGNYQPLTILSYALDYSLFRLEPFGYHLTNLILHLLNALLVFWLLLLLSKNGFIAFLGALIFAIHPLRVESVAWVSERKDVLYAFFFLGGLISYVYYLKSLKLYYVSLFLFVLSLLSKSMAVTFPLVLLLVDYFYRRNIDKRALLEKLPFFAVSVLFGIIAMQTQYCAGGIRQEGILNIGAKTGVAAYGIIFYLLKILFPLDLSALYPYHPVKNSLAYLPHVLFLSVIAGSIIYSAKYSRKLIFCSLFFLITLAPVLQFVPVGSAIVADRYSYVPSIGISYLAAVLCTGIYRKLIAREKSAAYFFAVIFFALALFLSFSARQRCRVWKDSLTLWNDIIKKYPNLALAFNNRGLYWLEKKEYDMAISDFNQAIKLRPKDAQTYNNLGISYYARGDFNKALFNYLRAIKMMPFYAQAHYNLGKLLHDKGYLEKSLFEYNTAIRYDPSYVEAYNIRGVVNFLLGRLPAALCDYNSALKIHRNYAECRYNRGLAYQAQNNFALAVVDFSRAIQIDCRYFRAYNARGNVYASCNFLDQAISDYGNALRLEPGFAEAYNNRAAAYFLKKEYALSRKDIESAEKLGFQVNKKLIENLNSAFKPR